MIESKEYRCLSAPAPWPLSCHAGALAARISRARACSLADGVAVALFVLLHLFAPQLLPQLAAQRVGDRAPASAAEVRDLGRLERPELVPVILPFLASSVSDVRAEAANALAQSLTPLAGASREVGADTLVARVASALRSRLVDESDARAAASVAQSLGRLPYGSSAESDEVEQLLVGRIVTTGDAHIAAGAARGLLALLRGVRSAGRPPTPPDPLLRALLTFVADSADSSVPRHWLDSSFAWPRRLIVLSLLASNSATIDVLADAARSRDPQLRMLAARGLGAGYDTVVAPAILRALAHDPAPMVRTEVALAWTRGGIAVCDDLLPLAVDSSPQTSLTAIDAMGSACAGAPSRAPGSALARLVRAGMNIEPGTGVRQEKGRIAMHRAAHAIVALAQLSPGLAGGLLPGVARSPAWQARMYAARAAAVLSDTAGLLALAADSAANVRSEAVAGLSRAVGHAVDSVYISTLASGDYQLVRESARALRGTPDPSAAIPALERSLARITAEKRKTSRDPRMAILQTLRSIGSSSLAEGLLPYLVDFDSSLADTAAAIVSDWTGRTHRSEPRPLPSVDEPLADVAALRAARVRVTMAASAGGGSFELRLLPDEAPLSVGRFARLVRSGYYDGLTIHRVVPNFVVQGGSPGANEYVGDGPFLRDEVGLRSRRRGAVGISTRGRNTGDAQIFIDLVDVPRLDHDYTVFAEVVRGMAVVDGLLEGDVMARVEILTN